jgi:hypothetical protein
MATEDKPYETICWRINETPANTDTPEEVGMGENCCQQPNRLKDKPQNCSPEQIRECHGGTKGHPCIKENSAPQHK